MPTRIIGLPLYADGTPYLFGVPVDGWQIKTSYGDVAKVEVTAPGTLLARLAKAAAEGLYTPPPPRPAPAVAVAPILVPSAPDTQPEPISPAPAADADVSLDPWPPAPAPRLAPSPVARGSGSGRRKD